MAGYLHLQTRVHRSVRFRLCELTGLEPHCASLCVRAPIWSAECSRPLYSSSTIVPTDISRPRRLGE